MNLYHKFQLEKDICEGWYKEKECINILDFENDLVELAENIEEINLYAKYIKE